MDELNLIGPSLKVGSQKNMKSKKISFLTEFPLLPDRLSRDHFLLETLLITIFDTSNHSNSLFTDSTYFSN